MIHQRQCRDFYKMGVQSADTGFDAMAANTGWDAAIDSLRQICRQLNRSSYEDQISDLDDMEEMDWRAMGRRHRFNEMLTYVECRLWLGCDDGIFQDDVKVLGYEEAE